LRRSCVIYDIPLPRHKHGYCQAELASFVKAAPLKKLLRWMYGQTGALEDGEHIYYTYDVVRWLDWQIRDVKPIWD
jgi:hypothetical protein